MPKNSAELEKLGWLMAHSDGSFRRRRSRRAGWSLGRSEAARVVGAVLMLTHAHPPKKSSMHRCEPEKMPFEKPIPGSPVRSRYFVDGAGSAEIARISWFQCYRGRHIASVTSARLPLWPCASRSHPSTAGISNRTAQALALPDLL